MLDLKVTAGQGEYVVFHQLPSGEKRQVSQETFEKVFPIFLKYSPAALRSEQVANRYDLLKAEIKELDTSLEAVFIPRTLYELVFIRKCIQEDLKHESFCKLLKRRYHTIDLDYFEGDQVQYNNFLEKKEKIQKERKCWHLCYFNDVGNNDDPGVKKVAHRLNKVIVKQFNPTNEGFTHNDFSKLAEGEIKFLKALYKFGSETMEKIDKGKTFDMKIMDCNKISPTQNFAYESDHGSIRRMGIRDETDAQIIKKAIELECSKVAQHSLFIFRGTNIHQDSVTCRHEIDRPYSISYGSSLFAGCIFDGGGTAFYYMRNKRDAYAIPIPFDQLNHSPFFVPTTHTVVQLLCEGEIFHARTKAWKGFDVNRLGGIERVGINARKRDHLQSELSKEEFVKQFQAYKNSAVQLK
jgi:hypothetical protein